MTSASVSEEASCSSLRASISFPQHVTLSKEHVDSGGGFMMETATVAHLPGGRSVRLVQQLGEDSLAPLFDGYAWAGTRVWEAALALTNEVIDRFLPQLRAGAKVVELGCGLGLPGMICAALGAKAVLTEVPEVCELLEENVASNFGSAVSASGVDPDARGTARVAVLRWDADRARALVDEEGSEFDIVLCCDCVYQTLYGDSWRALADCIVALCAPSTVAVFSLQRRCADDGIDLFLRKLRDSCLSLEKLPSRELDGSVVEVYIARRQREDAQTGGQSQDIRSQ